MALRDSIRRPWSERIVIAIGAFVIAAGASADSSLTDEIAVAVAATAADRGSTQQRERRQWLDRIYAPPTPDAVWFTSAGVRPSVAIALRELGRAEERGLAAAGYDIDRLARDIEAANRADPSPQAVAHADVALTSAVVHFLSDLRFGRVRPQDVERHYRVAAKDAGFVATLRGAAAGDALMSVIDSAEPSFSQYVRLKRLLAHYRDLAAQPAIPLPSLPAGRTKLTPGDAYAGVSMLREQLARFGDLPPDTTPPGDDRYSDAIAAAVMRFQQRHGLAADGVIGRQTLDALRVPARTRVRQIELSLERLRWLPDLPAGPLVAINIPSFRLWAVADGRQADHAILSMPVIVGKAIRGETPMFIGEMRYVEFSPYWNVPPSILRDELLPRLAGDPALLARDDMEMVGTRLPGPPVTVIDETTLAALRSGELRLRQRPGRNNALGGIKFVLPNTMDIYLHGTPARKLFERTRRDFSHGCIRVREPAALASFVLRDQPEWTPAQIDAAMASGTNRIVKLATTIPVVVFYTTAIVDATGRALFLPDVYGNDRKLIDALDKARRDAL